jgi:hypothetical protein
VGGDALRSQTFAALWGETCVRGADEDAAAEAAAADVTDVPGEQITFGGAVTSQMQLIHSLKPPGFNP